jgi:hypothetical protein
MIRKTIVRIGDLGEEGRASSLQLFNLMSLTKGDGGERQLNRKPSGCRRQAASWRRLLLGMLSPSGQTFDMATPSLMLCGWSRIHLMPRQLLAAALEQAERSDSVVRAAALLHIARVLDAFDHADAERVLEQGITLAEELPEPEREVILGQAVSLAATVSPARAIRLAPSVRDEMPGGLMRKALFDMLSHGHAAEAIQYLSGPATIGDYPFDAARQAMHRSNDEATRLRILHAAIAAVRRQIASGQRAGLFHGRGFLPTFTTWWRLLPVDEATMVVGAERDRPPIGARAREM